MSEFFSGLTISYNLYHVSWVNPAFSCSVLKSSFLCFQRLYICFEFRRPELRFFKDFLQLYPEASSAENDYQILSVGEMNIVAKLHYFFQLLDNPVHVIIGDFYNVEFPNPNFATFSVSFNK